MATIDVTPNPRILQMLGEIDFEPWQCLAELIDNSIDAYIGAINDDPDYLSSYAIDSYDIYVDLPSNDSFKRGIASITLSDSGPGMTLEQLQDSVRAGFSGNEPTGKLGLFGMGFNIATARLGRITEIRTTRYNDDSWLLLSLDLDKMQKTGEFTANIETEKKTDEEHGMHGTIVDVKKIKNEFKNKLTSGGGIGKIKGQLSRIYSSLLSNHPINIKLNSNFIQPFKHCHWSPSRTALVGSGKEEPSYIEIDEPLAENYFCRVCWLWSDKASVKNERCPACDSKVELKQRRVHGWLGIQRYFHKEHFGIDLIRNGRIIEQNNKNFFSWINEDGDTELEYPIDSMHWGGRIIGQINIDFAKVDYQKTSFEKQRKEWREISDLLRGRGPFRPKIAEKLGYEENTSPLGKLFKTFRTGNKPGRRYLVPGQRNNPLAGDNADAQAWAQKFYKGESNFETDEAWWERVEDAERALRGGRDDEPPTNPDDPFGDTPPDPNPDNDEPPIEETQLDRELCGDYEFPDPNIFGRPLSVTVFKNTAIVRKREMLSLPPLKLEVTGNRIKITYIPNHPAFVDFSETEQDYVLLEIASAFNKRVGDSSWSTSRIFQQLKNKYAEARKLDLNTLAYEAGNILKELKESLGDRKIQKSKEEISGDLKKQLDSIALINFGEIQKVDEMLENGTWIQEVSYEHVHELLVAQPELIMDGNFFKTSYEKVDDEELKKEMHDRILASLKEANRVKSAADRQTTPSKDLLVSAKAAIGYLQSQRA